MAEFDNETWEKLIKRHAQELETAAKEQASIDEAHYLLDILLKTFESQDGQARLANLDKFLKQIAFIEDFEVVNEFPNDIEQLEILSKRAMNFAIRESFRADINPDFAKEVKAFLEEFNDFVYAIKSSEKATFKSVVEEEKSGKRKVRFSTYKLREVPTKRLVVTTEQKQVQPQQPVQPRPQTQTPSASVGLADAEKHSVLTLLQRQPDQILRLDSRYFQDPVFVEQIKAVAIQNFPEVYKEYSKRIYGETIKRKTLIDETNKFELAVEEKIGKETRVIQSSKNGEGK